MLNFIKTSILYKKPTAWLVLIASLTLTFLVSVYSYKSNRQQLEAEFHSETLQLEQSIKQKIRDLGILMRASAGVFYASTQVSDEEWSDFVNGLELRANFPELNGLGYINVSGNQKSWSSVFQPSSGARLKSQATPNENETAKQWAMEKAMTSGLPVITPPLSLVDGKTMESQTGFYVYFPVYRKIRPDMTSEERKDSISGFVFTSFSARGFMESTGGVVRDRLHFQIFDGREVAQEKLVFNSHPDLGLNEVADQGLLSQSVLVSWPAQSWTLLSHHHEEVLHTFLQNETVVIAVFGIAADFLVFFLFLSLAQRKKELEADAEALEVRLATSESVLVSAVEAIGEAFVVYDEKDRLVFFNDKYVDIYKASAPSIELGNTFENIIRYGAERGQYVAAVGRVDEWVAERLAIHLEGKTDLIQLLDNGQWLKIRERKTPSGHIVGFRVDVTDLYAAKEAAEASNKAKSAFLATMSHEIRTPMNGMLGMAQVLLSPKLTGEERIDSARAILRSGQTLLNLLNDILDLSKIEAGKFKLDENIFSPVELVRECVFLNMETANRKQLLLRSHSGMDPTAFFMADSSRVKQMLGNLISNAIKFTQVGSVEVAVELQTDETLTEYLYFSVTDTGPGIPEKQRAQLFLPFVQADSSISRQFGGTGLGLSIVSHLAAMMGGQAGVDSELGQGAVFWFRIKAKRANSLSENNINNTKGDLANSFVQGVPQFLGHVLVAEDDPISRMVLMSALAKMGLTIVAVENGEKAVKVVSSGETFDLIFMDLSMPVLDGYAAAEKIVDWQLQKGKKIVPIVAISADAFDDSRKKCREHGMSGFIEKPINFNLLSQLIASYLPISGQVAHEAAVSVKVDEAKVVQWVDEIIPLLEEQRFDALAQFKQLRSYVAGSDIYSEIDAISKILNDLQFGLAVQRLRDLANSRSWKLSS